MMLRGRWDLSCGSESNHAGQTTDVLDLGVAVGRVTRAVATVHKHLVLDADVVGRHQVVAKAGGHMQQVFGATAEAVEQVVDLAGQAMSDITRDIRTEVLIIEDETIIALDLAAIVEESLDALHGGELALGVLLVDSGLTAAGCLGAAPEQFIGLVRGGLRDTGGGGSRHARTLAG